MRLLISTLVVYEKRLILCNDVSIIWPVVNKNSVQCVRVIL